MSLRPGPLGCHVHTLDCQIGVSVGVKFTVHGPSSHFCGIRPRVASFLKNFSYCRGLFSEGHAL
jgi:hypothetical protein